MSVSGPGLFANDSAWDIRSTFHELIGEGKNAAEAREVLWREFAPAFLEPHDEMVFWLALAAVQWKTGRLEEEVKRRALEIVEGGEELQSWDYNPKFLRQRRLVLRRLGQILTSDPPAPTKIRKPFTHITELEVGDLVSYRFQSGSQVILRVIGQDGGHHVVLPICEVLDWMGKEAPPRDLIMNLPIRRWGRFNEYSKLTLEEPGPRSRGRERLLRLQKKGPPAQSANGPRLVVPWLQIDSHLERIFGKSDTSN